MSEHSLERNLLFGALSLHLGFVGRSDLGPAIQAWGAEKHKPLSNILQERGLLNHHESTLLLALGERLIEKRGQDPPASLTALRPSVEVLRHEFTQIDDADCRAILDQILRAPSHEAPITESDRRNEWAQHETVEIDLASLGRSTPAIPPSSTKRSEPSTIDSPEPDAAVRAQLAAQSTVITNAAELTGRPSASPDGVNRMGDASTTVGTQSADRGKLAEKSTLDFDAAHQMRGVGRFRVVRSYLKGSNSEFVVAHDSELNREVVLKELSAQFANDDVCHENFWREAQIVGELEHPGVVPVYSFGKHPDGRPFYAMRFVRGENFKEAIHRFHGTHRTAHSRNWQRQRRHAAGTTTSDDRSDPVAHNLEFRELLGRFVDVCNVIEFAHSRGVIHRDLKPSNILCGIYGETLVVGWANAKAAGRRELAAHRSAATIRVSDTHVSFGTPAYMSPEQVDGNDEHVGPTSDIYSLGTLFYHVLTGESPYTADTTDAQLSQIRRGEIRSPAAVSPDVSPALAAVCRKAMALRAEDRYPTALALADDVEHWLAGEPVSCWQDGWSARFRRWLMRHFRS